MTSVLKVGACTIATALVGVYAAFVFLMLYRWFAMPLFELPSINLFQAWGLNQFASYATHQKPPNAEKKQTEKNGTELWAESIAYSIIYSTVCLIIAYVIHLLIQNSI